jgi:hypothetical protein
MGAASVEDIKLASDVVANAATIIALLVGGYWTWNTFVRERTSWPKADLKLTVSHRALTPTQTLLHAKVEVHNSGTALMKVTKLRVDVRQVLPLPEETAKRLREGSLVPEGKVKARWKTLDDGEGICTWGPGEEAEIEPGERDEFGSDFVIPADLEVVYLYVYVENAARKADRELGWTLTRYYELTKGGDSETIAEEAV